MNRLLIYLSLNQHKVAKELLAKCKFTSPYWQADNVGFYTDKRIGLSATQRFITPECHDCLMPYQDAVSGLVINADVYLTNRDYLCQQMAMPTDIADAKLILHAYLKWGEACTQHLAGYFCFVIWSPHNYELFAAVDQFSHCPLFYSYSPEQFFICANEFSSFRQLCPQLTLNKQHFLEFAFETFSLTETSYKEVLKLAPGHQLMVRKNVLVVNCYWQLKKQQRSSQSRHAYYAEFREQFAHAVKMCLRSSGPIVTHISGGLDSSAVTSQAAKLLGEQALYAFTAIPQGLSGPSNVKKGWYYHEMPLVEKVLALYPNIKHYAYTANPTTDILAVLKNFHPYIDQPIRNVSNFDWIMASYAYVLAQNGKTILTGAAGNGSISWTGTTLRNILGKLYRALKVSLIPRSPIYTNDVFVDLNSQLKNSLIGRNLAKQRTRIWHPQKVLLSGSINAGLKATAYPLQLYYGVRSLDPTQDLNIVNFCYNVPQAIYCRGNALLERRLLVREGLHGIVAEEILTNPYRGEQAADWYLQYNNNCHNWHDRLNKLHPDAQKVLWQNYDKEKMLAIFKDYPNIVNPPDKRMTYLINATFMRCLSMGFYLHDQYEG